MIDEFYPGVDMVAADYSGTESGITVWQVSPRSALSCDTQAAATLEPGAEAFLDWLRAHTDLVASDPVPVTVDGRPAISVDVRPAPGASGCVDGKLPLWQSWGNSAAVSLYSMARVIVLDVDDATLAIVVGGRPGGVAAPGSSEGDRGSRKMEQIWPRLATPDP